VSSKLERSHLGMITGMFMVGLFVIANMTSDVIPALTDLRASSELYYIVAVLAIGFILSQVFIWYYKRGMGGMSRNVK